VLKDWFLFVLYFFNFISNFFKLQFIWLLPSVSSEDSGLEGITFFCVALLRLLFGQNLTRVLNSFPPLVQVMMVSHKASELLPGGIRTA
jgi:hypothetical protein